MEPINFKLKNKKLLMKQLIDSHKDIPTNNSAMLFDYYRFVSKTKHDFLHYLILEALGRDWQEERPLSEYFEALPEEYGRKTPDILFENNGKWLMIDVSISHDRARNARIKREKYEPICEYLRKEHNIDIQFIHINLDRGYANIELELNKIFHETVKMFDYDFFFRLASIYDDKMRFINENIDKKTFEELKEQHFSANDPDSEEHEDIIFRDSLKYETMGKYQDIDIDYDGYMKYNSKFDLQKNICDNYNPKMEDVIVEFFTKVFDGNDNDVYKKYKDNQLDTKQFEEAETEIEQLNNGYQKMEAKPTHHIMIPIGEDDVHETTMCEQEAIMSFIKKYKEDYDNCPDNHLLNGKFEFMAHLSNEMLIALGNSPDAEHNTLVFNGQYKDDDLFKEYKKTKSKLKLYIAFKKKSKINQQLIFDCGYSFLKTNTDMITEIVKTELRPLKKIVMQKYGKENFSYRDFLREKNLVQEDDTHTYAKSNKLIKLSFSKTSPNAHLFYDKAGINKKIDVVDEKDSSIRETISLLEAKNMDIFLQKMTQTSPCDTNFREKEYLLNDQHYGCDEENVLNLKKMSRYNYEQIYEILVKTNCYRYSRRLHDCYKQLMHTSGINAKEKHFFMFNSGMANLLIVQATIFNQKGKDNAGPFFCILKTKTPDIYKTIFGKVRVMPTKDGYYYVCTNWRRLTLSKITFMRDTFYSTLSSTVNTFLSSPNTPRMFELNKIEKIYSLRTTIGYSTNQKIGELLMDLRYAYMSSFSHYTNINKLLVEKFGPPYKTNMEVWIVNTMLKKLPKIHKAVRQEGILQTKVEMEQNVRKFDTIGGIINLPSLWGDYLLSDVNDLLDEAFIYVHTMKEPSNIFHEQVKALKTIIKFQEEFDSLPEFIKKGNVNDLKSLQEYLLYDTKIGCSTNVIFDSVNYTLNKEKPNFKRIIHEIADETLAELLSTKAVISDLERDCVKEGTITKRDILKQKKRIKHTYKLQNDDVQDEKIEKYVLHTKSKYYGPKKLRQKVMETVLDILEENKEISKTTDLANHHICRQNGEVLADICIKAQYGAKREFYVVNIGAKATARVCENFFKKLSENSPNEAISIPGDKKTISMQSMLDRIYHSRTSEKHQLMYVNGDCTKWSAAETLSSFVAMTMALEKHITPNMFQALLATFNAWSDKEIQIPIDIRNKVVPSEKYHTDYLKDIKVTENNRYSSTQNFLQGMFNYASSYKAVCCNNYTYYLWKKIKPSSTLLIEHMEHSDDYVLLVLYEDKKEFEEFRVLQKIMMRLHGFNDSDRKTSCQPYLMEFVSQISFNGVMLYPQIKKSKEVNLNLPCTGYKQDMESALSRVGECQRVGCNQSFLYFFQRLHVYVVGEAYSVLPGMCNNFERTYSDLMNDPIELFGLPDILPIFSLYCRGNGNNYRLFKYGNATQRKTLMYMFTEAIKNAAKEDFLHEDMEYKNTLLSPKFMYEVFNKTIIKLRKNLDITPENIKSFWKEHITYKFLKPVDKENLILWIKCMFYNPIFLEAYAKTSRTAMTMRLSSFIKNKIIRSFVSIEDIIANKSEKKLECYTMEEYYYMVKNVISTNKEIEVKDFPTVDFLKTLTKCDPTYSIIYSVLSNLRINETIKPKSRTLQVAIKTPNKIKTMDLINPPSTLLQYILNKDDFIKDKRKLLSLDSLEMDINTIKNKLPIDKIDLTNPDTMLVLNLFNDLMINSEARNIMFGYNRFNNNIIDHIIEAYTYNFVPGNIMNVTTKDVVHVVDPFTNKLLYEKGNRVTKDYYRQCIETMCLIYIYFKFILKYDDYAVKQEMRKMTFKRYIEESNNYELLHYDDLLKRITLNYIDIFKYSLEDQKIIGYLKAVLTGNYDIIDGIVNSIYSFAYKYIVRDSPIGGEYKGETILQYTYFNTTVKVTYNENISKSPLLFINKHYPSIQNVLYNIAKKLTIGMSDYEFEKFLNNDNMLRLECNDIKNILQKISKKQVVTYCVVDRGNTVEFLKPENLKENVKYLPFFVTNEVLIRGGDIKFKHQDVRATCNTNNATVMLGKSKIFTLPFWKCCQYDVVSLKEEKIYDYVPFSKFLENRRLERYIKNKTTIVKDKVNLDNIVLNNLVDMICRNLERHRNYNYDLTDILKSYSHNSALSKILNSKRKVDKFKQRHSDIELDENTLTPEPLKIIKEMGLETYAIDEEEEEIKEEKPKISNYIPKMDDFIIEEEEEEIEEDLMAKIREKMQEEKKKIVDTKPDNVVNILKTMADTMMYNEDFIYEDNTVDMDEAIVMEEKISYNIETRYLGKDALAFGGFDINLSDILITAPSKIDNKKLMTQHGNRINYLYSIVKNREDFYMIQKMYDYFFVNDERYYNVNSYFYHLGNILERIDVLTENNEEGKHNDIIYSLFIALYYYLTRVYITLNKKDTITIRGRKGVLKHCYVTKDITPGNLDKLKDRIIAQEEYGYVIELTKTQYEKLFSELLKKELFTIQPFQLSTEFDVAYHNIDVLLMKKNNQNFIDILFE